MEEEVSWLLPASSLANQFGQLSRLQVTAGRQFILSVEVVVDLDWIGHIGGASGAALSEI